MSLQSMASKDLILQLPRRVRALQILSVRRCERSGMVMPMSWWLEGVKLPLPLWVWQGFQNMRALSFRSEAPQQASRPFDSDRDGFVLAEGAGVVVLEELEHARKRGAKIYGELMGYGASGDAGHITQPDGEGRGAARAMSMALEDAGVPPESIDYINAHGTSTPLGDKAETLAIKKVFTEHSKSLVVSSIKSHLGHTLGASGGIELVACAMALQHKRDSPDDKS